MELIDRLAQHREMMNEIVFNRHNLQGKLCPDAGDERIASIYAHDILLGKYRNKFELNIWAETFFHSMNHIQHIPNVLIEAKRKIDYIISL